MQGTYYEVRASTRVRTVREAEELAEQWARQLDTTVVVRQPWWSCFPLSPVLGRFGGGQP